MKHYIVVVGLFFFFLFSFSPKGVASSIVCSHQKETHLVDSIVQNVMKFAPCYGQLVKEYRANLYIKGKLHVKKKNLMFRYLPSLFRLRKGVREYIAESSSELHYTFPNIYDQKVKGTMGTLPSSGSLERELLEYFHVNIYSSTLLHDRLLSPLALNGKKYYRYQLDSVMGSPEDTQYKIRFMPKTKSDQLVGGYMIVSANVWSIRAIRFLGRSELIRFDNYVKMGEVGSDDEFLPQCYEFNALFKFMGNVIDGTYLASLDYDSISLEELKPHLEKKKTKYDLTESYTLECDTNTYQHDSLYFDSIRPIQLSASERILYKEYGLQRDTTRVRLPSKTRVFWGEVGSFLVNDYKVNLANVGSVKFSPLINPLLLSYGGQNGLSYKQSFNYSRLFNGGKMIRIIPKVGYNFTRKELHWSVNSLFDYWPEKQGIIHLDFGNGNRIYSSDVLDNIKEMPDSLFDFSQIHLEYFYDFYFSFSHSIEVRNGLTIDVGLLSHRRTPVQSSKIVPIYPHLPPTDDLLEGTVNELKHIHDD